jgi:hypothetical protein
MALINFPTVGVVTIAWSITPFAEVTRSDWTGTTRILKKGVPRWQASISVVPGSTAALLAWNAFFAQCDGPSNIFAVPAVEFAQTTLLAPQSVTAGQTTSPIVITGLPTSQTILPAGSRMVIGSSATDQQMFRLTADLVSNGSGVASAAINPGALQFPTVSGSAASLGRPAAVMRVTAGQPNGWSVSPGAIYTPHSFTCEEFF